MDCRERRCVGVRAVDVIEADDPHVSRHHSPALVDVAHGAQGQLVVRGLDALRQTTGSTHDVVAIARVPRVRLKDDGLNVVGLARLLVAEPAHLSIRPSGGSRDVDDVGKALGEQVLRSQARAAHVIDGDGRDTVEALFTRQHQDGREAPPRFDRDVDRRVLATQDDGTVDVEGREVAAQLTVGPVRVGQGHVVPGLR